MSLFKVMFNVRFLVFVGLMCLALVGYSTPPAELSLSTISINVGKSISALTVVLTNIALVAGIGFVLASLFKFHQHKLNPTQVPISQGVTLLLVGSALLVFPTIIGTSKKAIFGTATINKLSGGQITSIIGKAS